MEEKHHAAPGGSTEEGSGSYDSQLTAQAPSFYWTRDAEPSQLLVWAWLT